MLEPRDAARFAVGATVLRREVLHGRPWMEQPVTVVHDGPDCLAVLLEPGSPFTFFEHPFGPHPWSRFEAWRGSTVLQLQRDGEAHAAWKFFADGDGAATHWYVNFQEPVRRHPDDGGGGAFDTADLGVDIVLPADGPWQWKDVDDPDAMVAAGRISQVERERIRAEAAAVAARLDAGARWWSPWDDWQVGAPPPDRRVSGGAAALRRG